MSAAAGMQFDGTVITPSPDRIRSLQNIPDIMTTNFPQLEYFVDELIPRGAIVLWAGIGGTGKSYFAQRLAVSVATGSSFLGRHCQCSDVLVLDYENPGITVRSRLELMASGPLPRLKIWGNWLQEPPPQIGSELLLTIAQESKPLIIIDPFRFAHGAEENDSTEMAAVMQQLRYCATVGASVVILHHLAKTENSVSRGSTAIRDHSDIAWVQELNQDSGLISLKGSKNRFGDRLDVTIKPDFEEGTFQVTNSPLFTKYTDDLKKLQTLIAENPGLSLNSLHRLAGMMKARLSRLLKEHSGELWNTVPGPSRSILYYPKSVVLDFPEPLRTTEPPSMQLVGGSGGSPLIGERTTEPPPSRTTPSGSGALEPLPQKPNGKTLASCSSCGSFAIYRDKDGSTTCMTCSQSTGTEDHFVV
jgi:hypothetical protein